MEKNSAVHWTEHSVQCTMYKKKNSKKNVQKAGWMLNVECWKNLKIVAEKN